MNKRIKYSLSALAAVGMLCTAAIPAMAQDRSDDRAPAIEAMQYVRIHLDLGRYYMIEGQYEQAREHFQAVVDFDVPTPELERLTAEEREALDTDDRRRQHRRRHRARTGDRVDREALMMLIVTTHLLGDENGALAMAAEAHEESQCGAEEEGDGERRRRRPRSCAFERFIENPDEFAARFTGGPAELEERLLEIEAQLSNNE